MFSLFQVWDGPERGAKEKCYSRNDEYAESLAERAQEEPVPNQGREDHAGHHHKDDAHSGVHVVCQRQAQAQEGEQDDVGA